MLSVSNQRVKERTAFHILSDYVKRQDPRNKIFVLHRLDRETSGLMMFAKRKAVQEKMQADWNEVITQRSYVAVVEGRPEKETDLIISNLVENAQMQVYVAPAGADGKEAITRYRLLKKATTPTHYWNLNWKPVARTRFVPNCNRSVIPSPVTISMERKRIRQDG